MKCSFCTFKDTQVIESRLVGEGSAVRRRRECLKCKKRFTTYEKTKSSVLWIVKKDGRRELFDPEKIKRGILRAVEKRPVSIDRVDEIIDQVEREMLKKKNEEIESDVIGKAVLRRLKKIDNVAWLRFASVYMEFESLKDFSKVMRIKKQ